MRYTSLEVHSSWSDDSRSDIGETSGKEDGGTVLESDPGKQNHARDERLQWKAPCNCFSLLPPSLNLQTCFSH